jgi:hypothetical protein
MERVVASVGAVEESVADLSHPDNPLPCLFDSLPALEDDPASCSRFNSNRGLARIPSDLRSTHSASRWTLNSINGLQTPAAFLRLSPTLLRSFLCHGHFSLREFLLLVDCSAIGLASGAVCPWWSSHLALGCAVRAVESSKPAFALFSWLVGDSSSFF